MQSKPKDTIKTHCPYCDAVTTCNVLDTHKDIYDDAYWAETVTYALKCRGCEKPFILIRHANEDSDRDADGCIICDEETFPPVPSSQQHTMRDDLGFGIDEDYDKGYFASKLYHEISNSINADDLIVATLGMRSLIDTACLIKVNPPPVTNPKGKKDKRGFEQNLRDLYSEGYITANQKEVLLDILELGHGATHRQTKTPRKQVLTAFRIVEGIFDSLFTVPKLGEELKGHLAAKKNTP